MTSFANKQHHRQPSDIHRNKLSMTSDSTKDKNSNEMEDLKRIKDPNFVRRSKRWVVLVDDEESIRMAVGDFLFNQGYQVTACADADAMLEICAKPNAEGELPDVPDAIIRYVRVYITFNNKEKNWTQLKLQ
jgi:PleD family two-component response regulator